MALTAFAISPQHSRHHPDNGGVCLSVSLCLCLCLCLCLPACLLACLYFSVCLFVWSAALALAGQLHEAAVRPGAGGLLGEVRRGLPVRGRRRTAWLLSAAARTRPTAAAAARPARARLAKPPDPPQSPGGPPAEPQRPCLLFGGGASVFGAAAGSLPPAQKCGGGFCRLHAKHGGFASWSYRAGHVAVRIG